MHIRFNTRYLWWVMGLAGMFIVACGGSAPPAAPTVAATSVPPTTVVVTVTPVPPTVTPVPPTTTSAPAAMEQVESEPAVVVFRVTDRSIEAPESIPAGLTTIRLVNDGSVRHELTLIRADDGRTADELESQTKRQNWPATWAPPVASIRAEAGESNEFTVRLVPGIFAAVDWSAGSDSIPYSAFGAYTGFEVSESDSAGGAWSQDTVEIGLEDFFFTGIQDLSAGRQNFKILNRSDDQSHALTLVPLDEGQTAAELFENYRSVKFGGSSIENLERQVGIGWIGAGQEIEYSIELAAGNYAVVCLIPDGFPGRPHVNLGMLGQITVGG